MRLRLSQPSLQSEALQDLAEIAAAECKPWLVTVRARECVGDRQQTHLSALPWIVDKRIAQIRSALCRLTIVAR
jgi:hypothetical protein